MQAFCDRKDGSTAQAPSLRTVLISTCAHRKPKPRHCCSLNFVEERALVSLRKLMKLIRR